MRIVALWLHAGLLAVVLSAPLACAEEIAEARKQELIFAFGQEAYGFRADLLAPHEARWFLQWVLDVGMKRPGTSDDTFDAQLLQLGHEATVQKYGRQIKRGYFRATPVLKARQARLIEFYEPTIFLNEPAWGIWGGDTTPWRDSIGAAVGMLEQVHQSREVPKGVQSWAGTLKDEISTLGQSDSARSKQGLEEGRQIVRNWVAANKKALHARRFRDLKPGAVHSYVRARAATPQ